MNRKKITIDSRTYLVPETENDKGQSSISILSRVFNKTIKTLAIESASMSDFQSKTVLLSLIGNLIQVYSGNVPSLYADISQPSTVFDGYLSSIEPVVRDMSLFRDKFVEFETEGSFDGQPSV